MNDGWNGMGEELRAFLDRGWDWLGGEGRDGVLATVAGRGAEARTVRLRRADRAAATVRVHTDAATPKLQEIARTPGGTLLCWDPGLKLQLRLRLRLRVLPRDPADWAAVPLASRGNYGTVPPPGTPIPGPEAYRRSPDPARLAVIEGEVDEIDLVDLAPEMHRRALFRRADGWAGSWLAP